MGNLPDTKQVIDFSKTASSFLPASEQKSPGNAKQSRQTRHSSLVETRHDTTSEVSKIASFANKTSEGFSRAKAGTVMKEYMTARQMVEFQMNSKKGTLTGGIKGYFPQQKAGQSYDKPLYTSIKPAKIDTFLDQAAKSKAHVPPPGRYEILGDLKLKSKCCRADGMWPKEER